MHITQLLFEQMINQEGSTYASCVCFIGNGQSGLRKGIMQPQQNLISSYVDINKLGSECSSRLLFGVEAISSELVLFSSISSSIKISWRRQFQLQNAFSPLQYIYSNNNNNRLSNLNF